MSEKSTGILKNFVFLNIGKSCGNVKYFNQMFLIKPVKLGNINKNCFSSQNEPHTAKRCFPAVLKHFGGNSYKLLFLVQKVNISEKSTEILWNFFFLTYLKREKSWGKYGFVYPTVFDKTSEMGDILIKKSFSPESEPHTAKLRFSVVLKHFRGNSHRTFLFSPKSD